MLNPSTRATLAYLAGHWPERIPLTRSFFIGCLYIMDLELAPGCLSIQWDVAGYYPTNQGLLSSLDELGCLRSFRNAYLKDERLQEQVELLITEQQYKALALIIQQMNSYQSLADTFQLKSQMAAVMAKNRPK
jgi:hypothetical protein